MQRVLALGLAGVFLLTAAALVGCGAGEKTKIPDKKIELPKQGPVTPGGGGAAGGGAGTGTAQ